MTLNFDVPLQAEMDSWIAQVSTVTGTETAAAAGRAQTMPAKMEGSSSDKEQKKKGGFFTLGKKK